MVARRKASKEWKKKELKFNENGCIYVVVNGINAIEN